MSDQEILDVDIISALHLEHLTDEDKKEIKRKILFLVEKTVELRLLQMLKDEEIPQLEDIIKTKGDDSEDVLCYLQSLFPNAGDLYREELISVKRTLLPA